MPKPQDIFQLAQQEAVRVTASPQAWQSFLYTAAHNYHTTYLNQLLIHAQRPDAAACASMEYWNTKANRLVMRGSRSITVLQRRQGVAVTKPVFAIGDTIPLSQTRTGGRGKSPTQRARCFCKINLMTGWRRWHRRVSPTKLTVPAVFWNAM